MINIKVCTFLNKKQVLTIRYQVRCSDPNHIKIMCVSSFSACTWVINVHQHAACTFWSNYFNSTSQFLWVKCQRQVPQVALSNTDWSIVIQHVKPRTRSYSKQFKNLLYTLDQLNCMSITVTRQVSFSVFYLYQVNLKLCMLAINIHSELTPTGARLNTRWVAEEGVLIWSMYVSTLKDVGIAALF